MNQTLAPARIRTFFPATSSRGARVLLSYGALAGPLYVVVATAQAILRDGFDIRQHAVSLLSNGALGWIQVTNFLLAGVLTILGAVGVRDCLRGKPGGRWAPRLIALYGVSFIGAAAFTADPSFGFPAGTPDGPGPVSWHGLLHLLCGFVGFVGFVVACFVMARHFSRGGHRGWAVLSRCMGVFFLAAFVGIASGAGKAPVNIAFTAAIGLGWLWLTAVTLRLRRDTLGG
ncbi:DUF998 domain-containing protein [Micromonospora lupini]|uniref:DUF998 domain-containing protein n=1 Tax=Micromonospora lupini TaxID=285679 RepID=UPI002259506A|nr:DUF998 domain-containing protein [Micromonospora lupini]MCX5065991.1 DUF998 domain-containing protein [Micromonospora lupini]